jgi:hypothetical protein
MLARRHEETTYVVIPSTVRMPLVSIYIIMPLNDYVQGTDFLYNVQHDCPLAKCTASGKQPLMQERVQSGLVKTYIEHQPIERFVINTHAFHNAHLLRTTLPRSLVLPIPLHQDRRAKHSEIAVNLRIAQETKRNATKVRAVQKKLEAANSADDSGPGSKKQKRMRGEEMDGSAQSRVLDSRQQEVFEGTTHTRQGSE